MGLTVLLISIKREQVCTNVCIIFARTGAGVIKDLIFLIYSLNERSKKGQQKVADERGRECFVGLPSY